MGYHKGSARVALCVFDGRAANMDAFESLREMVEHYVGGQHKLYAPGYDGLELAA